MKISKYISFLIGYEKAIIVLNLSMNEVLDMPENSLNVRSKNTGKYLPYNIDTDIYHSYLTYFKVKFTGSALFQEHIMVSKIGL